MTLLVNRQIFNNLGDKDKSMVITATDAVMMTFREFGWENFPQDDRLADVESFIAAFVAANKISD